MQLLDIKVRNRLVRRLNSRRSLGAIKSKKDRFLQRVLQSLKISLVNSGKYEISADDGSMNSIKSLAESYEYKPE
jgi:hypothetical protein